MQPVNAFAEYLRNRVMTNPALAAPESNIIARTSMLSIISASGTFANDTINDVLKDDSLIMNRPLLGVILEPYAQPASTQSTNFSDVQAYVTAITNWIKSWKWRLQVDGKNLIDNEYVTMGAAGVEFDLRKLPVAVSTFQLEFDCTQVPAVPTLKEGNNGQGVYLTTVTEWIAAINIIVFKLEQGLPTYQQAKTIPSKLIPPKCC